MKLFALMSASGESPAAFRPDDVSDAGPLTPSCCGLPAVVADEAAPLPFSSAVVAEPAVSSALVAVSYETCETYFF